MKYLTCPFCGKNDIPDGATVCSGCQAEIEYNPLSDRVGAIGFFALLFGFVLFQASPIDRGAAVVSGAIGVFLLIVARRIRKSGNDRPVFKRRSHTR